MFTFRDMPRYVSMQTAVCWFCRRRLENLIGGVDGRPIRFPIHVPNIDRPGDPCLGSGQEVDVRTFARRTVLARPAQAR